MTQPPANTTGFVPTEDQLHALADGQLDEGTATRVRAWLAANPQAANEVASWRAQNEALREAFAPFHHASPADLPPKPEPRFWPRFAVAASLVIALAAGTVSGYTLRGPPDTSPGARILSARAFAGAASDAYLIYASEVRHPVEVSAADHDHLLAWLSKRLETPLLAPDLTGSGFSLMGGRLLPISGGAGAMFMYEDGGGERLTLVIGRNPGTIDTSFRFTGDGASRTFYWIEGGLGYALTGAVDRSTLEELAGAVYAQL